MNEKTKKTPLTGKTILEFFLNHQHPETMIGDYEEEYNFMANNKGTIRAVIWFWFQIMLVLPSFFINSVYWSSVMFRNYLKTSLRNLLKYKGYSFINITGLTIGITCSVLILLWVNNELSYDRFHENSDRIYRVDVRAVWGDTKIRQAFTPALLTPTMRKDFPEMEEGVKISKWGGTTIICDDRTFNEDGILAVDSTFFDVFSFGLVKGDRNNVLKEPNSVVLTVSTADRLFGTEDPVGKIILIDSDRQFTVTGIAENVPANSHFHFDYLLSLNTFEYNRSRNWFANNFRTYILLREGADYRQLDAKFPDFVSRYLFEGGNYEEWAANGNFWEFYLQPLTDIHLNSHLSGEFEPNGNKAYVYIFFIVAMFILAIASINFVNLTTARSANRAKEVGIRKVVGSVRQQLIQQFLGESILISTLSVTLSVIAVKVLLPYFSNLVGTHLEFNILQEVLILPGLIISALALGIFSGIYPAFFLSSFKPAAVLKGKVREGVKNSVLRNGLVIFQFAISVVLIICTLIVFKQLEFLQNEKLGFEKEQVIVVKNGREVRDQMNPFREKLLQHPGIKIVSASHTLPGRFLNNILFNPEGEESLTLNIISCDEDFLESLKMEMDKGRFFSKDFPTDSSAIIINQTAARLLNWDEPLGKQFSGFGRQAMTVIGVIKDFHYASMRQEIRPMALIPLGINNGWNTNYVSIRVQIEDIPGTIGYIKKTWDSFVPEMTFEYSFLDEDFNSLYNNEQRTGRVFTVFMLLAVFIACLGLFGLASFMAEQRTKEIGIRKTLGASVSHIAMMLSGDFLKWIIISNIIAWPIAWYGMNTWLQDFAFRIRISFWFFLIAGVAALAFALLTVSYQAIKAARANPVDALKYE